RLSFRKDAIAFLHTLTQEDPAFVAAIDRMLRALWRTNLADGEDIAYLLGRISGQQEIDVAELRDENVMVHFWPIVGEQLREELEVGVTAAPAEEGDTETPVPTMTPEERLAGWEQLAATFEAWWPHVPEWEREARAMFQL